MTLTDTGPLVALIDRNDTHHSACAAGLPRLVMPMLTTWPCFTEAMHLVGRAGGHKGQDALWGYLEDGILQIYEISPAERVRMRELMAKYSDTPMDLADASLVAAAETLNVRRVFTVDSDFVVYRTANKGAFEAVP